MIFAYVVPQSGIYSPHIFLPSRLLTDFFLLLTGMFLPVGKLSLHTACHTLPITCPRGHLSFYFPELFDAFFICLDWLVLFSSLEYMLLKAKSSICFGHYFLCWVEQFAHFLSKYLLMESKERWTDSEWIIVDSVSFPGFSGSFSDFYFSFSCLPILSSLPSMPLAFWSHKATQDF